VRFASVLLIVQALAACAAPESGIAGQLIPDPGNAWPHETSQLEPDPAVSWVRLESGFRYVLLPNTMPPGRVSLRLLIGAGSLDEKPGQSGLAHFLEHMAFQGSRTMPAGQLVNYLERLGMAFGPDTNAYTAYDVTVYQLELPQNDREMVGKGLQVMRDTLDGLLLPAEEIDRERSVVLSEKRSRDSSMYRAQLARLEFLLPDSLIVDRPVIGSDEVLQMAGRDSIDEFYRRNYVPSNAVLVAAGDFDRRELDQLVRETFAAMPAAGPVQRVGPGSVGARGRQVAVHYEPNSPIVLTLNSVQALARQPDSLERNLEDLYRYMANSLLSRRLQEHTREENAAIVDAQLVSNDMLDFARINTLHVVPAQGQWREALTLAEQELRRALIFGFTQVEVEQSRASILNALEQSVRGSSTRSSRLLADQLLESVQEGRVFTHPATDLRLAQPALQAVDGATLLAALRNCWPDGELLLFASGSLDMEQPVEALREVLEASAQVQVFAPEQKKRVPFAYTDFGSPGRISERSEIAELGVTQVLFENGVRVNIKPTQFEQGRVRVGLRVGTGRLDYPLSKPGLDLFLQLAFRAGGLGAHDAEDLSRILSGRNYSLGVSVTDDAFVFSGTTTTDDLALQLQVMTAYLSDAGYRDEAQNQVDQQLPVLYKQLEHVAAGVLSARSGELLHENDARFVLPPRKVLMERNLQELRQWLEPHLKQGYLEITLVGDLDVDAALLHIAATLGALPKRQSTKDRPQAALRTRFPADRSLQTFDYDPSTPKAMVAMYWPADDGFDPRRSREITLLTQVLENRVVQEIRVEQGEAYSPSASSLASQVFPGYGYISVMFDVQPDRALTILNRIAGIAEEIASGGISDDELLRARRPLLARYRQAQTSNGFWLQNLMDLQERPQRAQRISSLVADLESVTAAELVELAGRYFAPGQALPVMVIPRSQADAT